MEALFEHDITGSIGTTKYQCTIRWRNGEFFMDGPQNIGGGDTGPDPFSTLLASLAGCTLSTLRMYIDRKGWDIPEIGIAMNIQYTPLMTEISRKITFVNAVTTEQKERLLEIAEKCPISKILKGSTTINTSM